MKNLEKNFSLCNDIRNLFEQENKNPEQISKQLHLSIKKVRRILKGELYDGLGKSDKYLETNANRILDIETQLRIVEDYLNGKPIPEILEEYSISRLNLQYYRKKFNAPERNLNRAVSLKSITLSVNGEVRTYPSVESASKSLNLPSDFLFKLKRAKTFCEGENSKKDLYLVHDLNRLVNLEKACELMNNILYNGTASEKFIWGDKLKTLLYELGYISDLDYN